MSQNPAALALWFIYTNFNMMNCLENLSTNVIVLVGIKLLIIHDVALDLDDTKCFKLFHKDQDT